MILPAKHIDVKSDSPLLTIFTVLKPFEGETDVHQRNSLASWSALGPRVEIILISDSIIPTDIRSEFRCFPSTKTNQFGTPLLDEAFSLAAAEGRGAVRAFVNADIILDRRFVDAVDRLIQSELKSWLAIGRRIELDMPISADRTGEDWIANCFRNIDSRGARASIVCKDYFIFTADLFREIPAFAIGRGNWDSWMVRHSKAAGIPVVDIGEFAPVIHQKHGYSHIWGGRMSAYVSGPEARANQRLAGGRNLLAGSTPNWRLHETRISRVFMPTLTFGKDVFRFASLLGSLVFSRF